MFESILSDYVVPLLTLTALEIVLGIDNIVFINILTGKLPKDQQRKVRNTGLTLAMLMRIALLLAIGWVITLENNLFTILKGTWFEHGFSGKDLILLAGGLFLVAKATYEIHHKLQHGPLPHDAPKLPFVQAIAQILLLDAVFSLDSVITAVGMAKKIEVMIAAVMIAVAVMLVFAGKIGDFIERHAGLKMLALSFLLLIGVTLIIEGWAAGRPGDKAVHIDKGYIYVAMGFALFVELLNIRFETKSAKSRASQTASGEIASGERGA